MSFLMHKLNTFTAFATGSSRYDIENEFDGIQTQHTCIYAIK